MRKFMLILALVVGGSACVGRGYTRTYATVGVTAAPRVSYVEEYPGWLWVDGHYRRHGASQVWVEGYWVEHRPGYVYRPGYYHPRNNIWIEGTWSARPRYHSYHRMPRGVRVYKAPPPHRRHRPYY